MPELSNYWTKLTIQVCVCVCGGRSGVFMCALIDKGCVLLSISFVLTKHDSGIRLQCYICVYCVHSN